MSREAEKDKSTTISGVVSDIKFLIATNCNDETLASRIESYSNQQTKGLSELNEELKQKFIDEAKSNIILKDDKSRLKQENERVSKGIKKCIDYLESNPLWHRKGAIGILNHTLTKTKGK